jgi:hypothetical protein
MNDKPMLHFINTLQDDPVLVTARLAAKEINPIEDEPDLDRVVLTARRWELNTSLVERITYVRLDPEEYAEVEAALEVLRKHSNRNGVMDQP